MNGIMINKNAAEQIRIERRTYEGHDLIDVRVCVPGKDDELIPTRKGVCCRVETWCEITEVVNKLLKQESC